MQLFHQLHLKSAWNRVRNLQMHMAIFWMLRNMANLMVTVKGLCRFLRSFLKRHKRPVWSPHTLWKFNGISTIYCGSLELTGWNSIFETIFSFCPDASFTHLLNRYLPNDILVSVLGLKIALFLCLCKHCIFPGTEIEGVIFKWYLFTT